MTPSMLRQLWSIVETTQAHFLLKMDDASLIHWLLNQLNPPNDFTQDQEQTEIFRDYIRRKLPLIRDLAQQR